MPADEEEKKGPETEVVKEPDEAEGESPQEKKVEIRIKDFAVYKPCMNCGKVKVPYIEVEIDGKAEYTCKECYDAQFAPKTLVKCPSCSSEGEEFDNFCWKCGYRLRATCSQCGIKADPNDKFCRQCGNKL